jgi:hypothetical protein
MGNDFHEGDASNEGGIPFREARLIHATHHVDANIGITIDPHATSIGPAFVDVIWDPEQIQLNAHRYPAVAGPDDRDPIIGRKRRCLPIAPRGVEQGEVIETGRSRSGKFSADTS